MSSATRKSIAKKAAFTSRHRVMPTKFINRSKHTVDDRYDDEVTDAHLDTLEDALEPHRPANVPRFNRKK